MTGLTVREFILALLDFPLDSEVCVEDGYGSDSYPVFSIYHDSDYDDMGYLIYSYTSIVHGGNLRLCSDDVMNRDYRGEWVNTEETFEFYDDEKDEFVKVRFKDHKLIRVKDEDLI